MDQDLKTADFIYSDIYLSILVEQSCLKSKNRKYTFDNFSINESNTIIHDKVKKYAMDFVNYKKDKSLILTGECGTGKTHLACSVCNLLLERGISVIYGTLISLLGNIKSTYGISNNTEEKCMNRYATVDLLVIDDLGKEKPSEWGLEKLFTIINNRYENELPVIITTNFDRNKLRERLCCNQNYETVDSIISRLYEMCIGIKIIDKDYRKS